MTTTHPDIYWAVTCQIPADQIACSLNWGGISPLFEKKLWLRQVWQGLLDSNPEPATPQLDDFGRRQLLGALRLRACICTVYGTPEPSHPEGNVITGSYLSHWAVGVGEPPTST